MLKIGVLVSGGGTNLQALIDSRKKGELGAEIAVVVSSNSRAYAVERARQNGIPAFCVTKKDCPEGNITRAIKEILKKHEIGLVITAGFNVILKEEFFDEYRNRVINIHPTLIPSFCGKGFYGLRVHEIVLESGVKVTGATVHFVTEETDAGPIILQKPVFVRQDDTPETLQKRVMEEAEQILLPEAVRLFSENRLEIKGNRVIIQGTRPMSSVHKD